MSDIVERLREVRGVLDNRWPGPTPMDLEAAGEIERLRAAIEDAVDTLEAMDLHMDNPLYDRLRAVLEGSSGVVVNARTMRELAARLDAHATKYTNEYGYLPEDLTRAANALRAALPPSQESQAETYTEICMNEKCPRGCGVPIEVVRPLTRPEPQSAREEIAIRAAQIDERWRQALRDLRELAIDEGNKKIERRCFDLIMAGPAHPRPESETP